MVQTIVRINVTVAIVYWWPDFVALISNATANIMMMSMIIPPIVIPVASAVEVVTTLDSASYEAVYDYFAVYSIKFSIVDVMSAENLDTTLFIYYVFISTFLLLEIVRLKSLTYLISFSLNTHVYWFVNVTKLLTLLLIILRYYL